MNLSGNGGISEVCPITTITLFILIFDCDEKRSFLRIDCISGSPSLKRYDGKSRLSEQVRSIPGVRVGTQLESNDYEGIYRETSYNKANMCESNPR